MKKKASKIILGILILAGAVFVGVFYWKNLRGIGLILKPATKEVANLKLPAEFGMEIFAENLSGARVMAMDGMGNIWVSRTGEGKVTLLEIQNGKVTHQSDIFQGLNKPHGLALDPQDPLTLYIAETDKISKVRLYTEAEMEKIIDLPGGGNHFTRTIAFGPDNNLYVSVGSSCNVCRESEYGRASVRKIQKSVSVSKEPLSPKSEGTVDGSLYTTPIWVSEIFASGLRNNVFFTWNYIDGKMWGTDMGRDLLGDNLPPDEINIIQQGKNYGWPYCYGKNVRDLTVSFPDQPTHWSGDFKPDFCEKNAEPSYIDIPAHSSPLGLAFVPEEGWPEEYWYNLLVAYHGSWNRTEPTGYKIVRMKLDAKGNYFGTEDFISGWLQENGSVIGRPVDILIQPGGTMYISDDKAGVIYKVFRKSQI